MYLLCNGIGSMQGMWEFGPEPILQACFSHLQAYRIYRVHIKTVVDGENITDILVCEVDFGQ